MGNSEADINHCPDRTIRLWRHGLIEVPALGVRPPGNLLMCCEKTGPETYPMVIRVSEILSFKPDKVQERVPDHPEETKEREITLVHMCGTCFETTLRFDEFKALVLHCLERKWETLVP